MEGALFLSSSHLSSPDPLETSLRAFPYEHPSTLHLLILLSLLYLLNVVGMVADHLFYGGVIAQICLGTIYGSPLANILPQSWETTFTALGYIGLIGIIFEGGLSTDPGVLLSNLPLSALCATVGILVPIAFSFALLSGAFGYPPLEAFASGIALCTTSLGTTLMTLHSTSKSTRNVTRSREIIREQTIESTIAPTLLFDVDAFRSSRIVVVLISAAMINDVVGLILASLIPALASRRSDAGDSTTNMAWLIIRPLLSSFLIAVITPLIARFVLRPVYLWMARRLAGWKMHFPGHVHAKISLMVVFVFAFMSISYYSGSSLLFGAYIAGVAASYVSHPGVDPKSGDASHLDSYASDLSGPFATPPSFEDIYKKYIGPLQHYLLVPLFFASIGHAIPFVSLWNPTILWKGIVYSILMALSKFAVGVPIIMWGVLFPKFHRKKKNLPPVVLDVDKVPDPDIENAIEDIEPPLAAEVITEVDIVEEEKDVEVACTEAPQRVPFSRSSTKVDPPLNKPPSSPFRSSLFPALLVGSAMVSRGEIGLLIAQIAKESAGGLMTDDVYLISIWAILLCTLIGPIIVGFLITRWGFRMNQGVWS